MQQIKMEGLEINTCDTNHELETKALDRRHLAAGGNVVSSTQQQPSPTTATAAAASSIVSEQSPPTTSSVYSGGINYYDDHDNGNEANEVAIVVSTTSRASSVESSKRKRAPAGNNYALDAKRRRDGPQPSQQQQQPPTQQQVVSPSSTGNRSMMRRGNSISSNGKTPDEDVSLKNCMKDCISQDKMDEEERDESALMFDIQNHPLAVASKINFALSDANNLRNAWSLMIRFDFDLYIHALQCTDPGQILAIRKQFHMLHLYMQMIVTYGQTNNLNYSLPAASITRLNELVEKERAYRTEKNITLEEAYLEELRNSNNIHKMIGFMDYEVHHLMIVLCKSQFLFGNNNSTSKKQRNMILVQEVDDDMYQKYVAHRIRRNQESHKIYMNSFFVVSLSPNYTSQFQTFHEYSGVLLKQIQSRIKKYIFRGRPIPKNHVSMKYMLTKDCKHHRTLQSLTANELQQMNTIIKPTNCDSKSGKCVSSMNLLDAHYDPSGLLALVNIDYIEIQSQKPINVNVNIKATFSSITTQKKKITRRK